MESHVFVANDQYRTERGRGGNSVPSFPSAGNFESAAPGRSVGAAAAMELRNYAEHVSRAIQI